ncbi:MAG: hypothetical protein R3286_11670 [Gammaproteobacteria bacterium]|nr:hypothetical protein [Gammaproteobacteria bacterium]
MTADPGALGADDELAMAEFLAHRFGDGLVYLRDDSDRELLRLAVRRGLVSAEGYVTPRGLALLARHGDD